MKKKDSTDDHSKSRHYYVYYFQSLRYQSNIVIFMSYATDQTEAKIVEEQLTLMEDEHDERGEERTTPE